MENMDFLNRVQLLDIPCSSGSMSGVFQAAVLIAAKIIDFVPCLNESNELT